MGPRVPKPETRNRARRQLLQGPITFALSCCIVSVQASVIPLITHNQLSDMYVCLSIFLSVCLYVSTYLRLLSICLSQSTNLSIYLSSYLPFFPSFMHPAIYLSICLSICLSFCPSNYLASYRSLSSYLSICLATLDLATDLSISKATLTYLPAYGPIDSSIDVPTCPLPT